MVFRLRTGRCVYAVPVANVEIGWSRFEASFNRSIRNWFEGSDGRIHSKIINYIVFSIGSRMCSLFYQLCSISTLYHLEHNVESLETAY